MIEQMVAVGLFVLVVAFAVFAVFDEIRLSRNEKNMRGK